MAVAVLTLCGLMYNLSQILSDRLSSPGLISVKWEPYYLPQSIGGLNEVMYGGHLEPFQTCRRH